MAERFKAPDQFRTQRVVSSNPGPSGDGGGVVGRGRFGVGEVQGQ